MIPVCNKNQLYYGVEFDQDTFYELCEASDIRFNDPLSSIKEDFKEYLDQTDGYDFFTLLDNGNIFFGYPINLGNDRDGPIEFISEVCNAVESFNEIKCWRFGTVVYTFGCFNKEYRMFKIL